MAFSKGGARAGTEFPLLAHSCRSWCPFSFCLLSTGPRGLAARTIRMVGPVRAGGRQATSSPRIGSARPGARPDHHHREHGGRNGRWASQMSPRRSADGIHAAGPSACSWSIPPVENPRNYDPTHGLARSRSRRSAQRDSSPGPGFPASTTSRICDRARRPRTSISITRAPESAAITQLSIRD